MIEKGPRRLLRAAVMASVLLTAQLSVAETIQYEYDAGNRLTKVIYGSYLTVEYAYDDTGNRTLRGVTENYVSLEFVINTLQVMTGAVDYATDKLIPDFSGNGAIDMAEIIYVLRKLAL